MAQVLAVFRKELLEVLADRQSLRGTALQTAIFFGMCGVFVPWRSTSGDMWQSLATMLVLYALLPTVIATSVAADAFAGELERGTLESLLATSVSDAAVFWGKALTAVSMSLALCLACLASAAFITVRVHGLPLSTVNGRIVALVILGHIAASTCLTAIAVYISARVKVARAAQQAVSIGTLVGVFVLSAAGRFLSIDQLPKVLLGEVALFLAGCAGLTAMARFIRRDRIFEEN